MTTGATYIEIIRLVQLPEDQDDLVRALEKLGREPLESQMDVDMAMSDEEDEVGGTSFIATHNLTMN